MELRSQESRPKRTACRAKCLVHRRWKLDGGNSEITSPLERFYGSGFPTRVQDFQKLQFQAYSYIGFCCIDCPSWNVLSFCSGTCPWGEEATCTFRLRCFQEIATTPATINTRIRAQTEQNIRNQTGNNYRSKIRCRLILVDLLQDGIGPEDPSHISFHPLHFAISF